MSSHEEEIKKTHARLIAEYIGRRLKEMIKPSRFEFVKNGDNNRVICSYPFTYIKTRFKIGPKKKEVANKMDKKDVKAYKHATKLRDYCKEHIDIRDNGDFNCESCVFYSGSSDCDYTSKNPLYNNSSPKCGLSEYIIGNIISI